MKINLHELSIIEEFFSIRINKLTSGLLLMRIPIRAFKLENIGEIEIINFRKILQVQLQTINYIHCT